MKAKKESKEKQLTVKEVYKMTVEDFLKLLDIVDFDSVQNIIMANTEAKNTPAEWICYIRSKFAMNLKIEIIKNILSVLSEKDNENPDHLKIYKELESIIHFCEKLGNIDLKPNDDVFKDIIPEGYPPEEFCITDDSPASISSTIKDNAKCTTSQKQTIDKPKRDSKGRFIKKK